VSRLLCLRCDKCGHEAYSQKNDDGETWPPAKSCECGAPYEVLGEEDVSDNGQHVQQGMRPEKGSKPALGDLSFRFRWRKAITTSSLTATQRHVAHVLGLHMNSDGGSCYPSIALIALETGYSRRAVQYGLRVLEAKGWIRREAGGKKGGRGLEHTSRYQARIPRGAPVARRGATETHRGAPEYPKGRNGCTLGSQLGSQEKGAVT
jgi:hypothetical protein